ncbi:toll/interleukin-1 receptor domain-containing protein [Deefgea piscis]|uniref:Toll/interleukin-1 receptor domain-containing protein n=2 Tax=Deefgea piscis TaxID=2739061 RepID=A0A6M8T0D0_9NEIS|nr:toll/interleukin-1 receptor domain-containing protein [Deefgea piscis]
MKKPPKIFISYSHDSEEHKEWVLTLATKLVCDGVDVLLDQWDLPLGSNLTKFMEQGLTNSERVLVICTDNYNAKANIGTGGVGYEKNILTSELMVSQDSKKFIPCIRGVSGSVKTPICLASRTYIEFSNDIDFEDNYKFLLHELHDVPLKKKPKLGDNPFLLIDEEKSTVCDVEFPAGENSSTFFSERFAAAFPGVRGIEWFTEPSVAVERLRLLLKYPIKFAGYSPIWWWRDGDLHIDELTVLSSNTVQLGRQELIIDEVVAVNIGAYWQQFLYVKTSPSVPSCFFDISRIDAQIENWGYAYEEYADFNGVLIRREEYDDGAAVIDGKVVNLNGEAKLIEKFLTPYNFIIAPNDSPINNHIFDSRRVEVLNAILKQEMTVEDLAKEVLTLPKRNWK